LFLTEICTLYEPQLNVSVCTQVV